MSKQLAVSIALSVMATLAIALFGTDHPGQPDPGASLRLPISAHAPTLPELTQLLPALQ